jgi:site-specific DNA-cytosine methylase
MEIGDLISGIGSSRDATNYRPVTDRNKNKSSPDHWSAKRYMIPRECALLQNTHELQHLPESATGSFKALGNAVNVDLIELVARELLNSSSCSALHPRYSIDRSVTCSPTQVSKSFRRSAS